MAIQISSRFVFYIYLERYIWKVFLQHSNTFLTFIINSNSNSIFINSFIIYMRRMKQKLLYKAKLLFKKSEYC